MASKSPKGGRSVARKPAAAVTAGNIPPMLAAESQVDVVQPVVTPVADTAVPAPVEAPSEVAVVIDAPVAEPAPVAAAEPVEIAPQSAPAPQEETTMTDTMQMTETTAADATAKTQAMFGDLNTRAKAAMEKSTKMIEEANSFSKGNLEAIVESGKIAAKGLETLSQEAAEFSRKQFESTTAILKSFASVKSPTEFFQLQSDYARKAFDAMMAENSKTTETMMKLTGDVMQPISNRMALAAEKIKTNA